MEFPWLELVAAQVSNRLKARIEGGLGRCLANFVPRRSGMEHLNRSVARFFCRLDLFGMLVAVSDFQCERVVADVPLDVDAKIDFNAVAFLEYHVAVPTFHAFHLMIGGEMGRQIVHGDGAGKRWFSAVAVDEAFCGFNDLVEGLAGLKFILHGFEGSSSDVPCISPILQVGFFHHSITLCEGMMPSLITVTSTSCSPAVTLRMVLPTPPGHVPGRMACVGNFRPAPASWAVEAGVSPDSLALVAVMGPNVSTSSRAVG